MLGTNCHFLSVFGVLLIVAGLTTLQHHTARAAGPTIMIVHGESLAAPIRINLWDEGFSPLSGPEIQFDESELNGRPYLNLGFLWGPEWSEHLASGGSLDDVQAGQANWHGRLYSAGNDGQPVIYATGYGYRLLKPETLRLLEEHGVPLRPILEASDGDGSSNLAIWWGLGLTAILLGGAIAAARARDPERKLGSGASYGYR